MCVSAEVASRVVYFILKKMARVSSVSHTHWVGDSAVVRMRCSAPIMLLRFSFF